MNWTFIEFSNSTKATDITNYIRLNGIDYYIVYSIHLEQQLCLLHISESY